MGPSPTNRLACWIPLGLLGKHSLQNVGTVKLYSLDGLDVKALILDLITQDATQILVRFSGKLFTATPTDNGYERKEVVNHALLWYLQIGDPETETVDLLEDWNAKNPEPTYVSGGSRGVSKQAKMVQTTKRLI